MRAIIFGAGGMVGRALVRAAPAGAAVTALDRARCDILDRAAVESAIAAVGPDIVVNAAAFTAVDQAETEPAIAAALNADAPGRIAAAARSAGARLVHISTDYVFDGRSGQPYRPADAAHPLNAYGRTKLDGEHAVLAADPGALVVRTAWVFGDRAGTFVPSLLALLRRGEPIKVVADQIGTPTADNSLARALWTLAGAGACGVHHFTDAGSASRYDQAVAIRADAEECGLIDKGCAIIPVNAVDRPSPATRPYYSLLDKTATWAITGIPPHWREGLRALIQTAAAAEPDPSR